MRNASFQFNERDAEIVHQVHQLRVATLDHLVALTSRSYKTLERRVPKLRKEKYLHRLRPRPQKGMYIIGPEGVQALIEHGHSPDEFSDKRMRQAEWKDLTIPHALFIATIHAKLLVASRTGPIKLVEWRHEHPELWDSVLAENDKRLPIRPDAFFTLQDMRRPPGRDKFPLFLEADVGTMSHDRIRLKVMAYSVYHGQQKHVAKYGVSDFHVAIITQTPARAANLRAELYPGMSRAQRRAYPILPIEDLTPESLVLKAERPSTM